MVKKESKTARAKRLAENTARYRDKKRELGLVPCIVDVFEIDKPSVRACADALIEARLQKMKENMIGILPTNGDENK